MSNIREWGVWDTAFFTSDPGFHGVMALMVGGTGYALMCCATVLGPGALNPFLMIPLFVLLWLGTAAFVFLGHKIGVLDSLPKSGYTYYDQRQYNFQARGREYLSLSSADRALYPSNILDLMKNPDLSYDQRVQLDESMSAIYYEIMDRDKAKAELARQARVQRIDVDDIVQRLADSKESVSVETKTWTEEVEKLKELL
jgi:hypothetical protein